MKRVLEFDISAQVKRGNPKFQIPNSKQIPSTKSQRGTKVPFGATRGRTPGFGIWNLELVWNLGFGIWDF
jgi:hypothetical protein